ncbi:MAG TPA: Dabb family protein [Candidatus Latescibacteria bacterium]|nr:Dabb family protein [Candidatus Handelsmanbacteria bacterium]HIL09602.1 Dabb family protein [Candidatus Latescibacterota bacterium]
MIRHTVVFKLKHAAGSEAEFAFLHAAQKLATDIAVVKNFEALRQTSKKNNYDFGLSMEFASEEDYQIYNEHPLHLQFVETRWLFEVADFIEIDYKPYTEA